MEITIDIGYEQLLAAIKKLPAAKIKQLKSVSNEEFIEQKASKDLSDFQVKNNISSINKTEKISTHGE